jgi:hypothetical protein
MTEQELSYHEAMAALPAYAAGILNEEKHAKVEAYLQRQIALFQHLDALEAAAGVAEPAPTGSHRAGRHQGADEARFAQLMEGQADSQQLADNPLLMRKAPRTYTDRRTGQRFVIPRRGTLQPESAPRAFPTTGPSWRTTIGRTLWNLLALAAVVAVVIISVNQIYLQRQLTIAQEQLTLSSRAEQLILLRGPSAPTAMQGALALHTGRALLLLSQVEPLPAGRVYQLWVSLDSGERHSAALITPPRAPADLQLLLPLPVDAATIVAAGLSMEPASGSAQPTTALVLAGRVDRE